MPGLIRLQDRVVADERFRGVNVPVTVPPTLFESVHVPLNLVPASVAIIDPE